MTAQSIIVRLGTFAIAATLVTGRPATAAQPSATTNGWGVPLTDVTPDPSIKYGMLPNGMKYAIMRNATPRGAAAVRIQFAFGSIGEAENERGLAHFIEHMAFNGTTHVPEGDMIKILQRQGLAFGPDTNAFTDFDTTTYVLDLPSTDEQHLDTAFFLFRELASEVKFDPAAVDRERGVILSEERSRDNFRLHQMVDMLGFQAPLTPYPDRIPIGLDSVLKTASADTIRNLYHRYYRPENATLVFVGDADPGAIEARIVKAFADWKGTGPAAGPLPRGKVDLARPAAFHTFVDPAVATMVSYTITRPWQDPADTLGERRHRIIKAIASAAFNRRLERLVNTPGSGLLGARMATSQDQDAALTTTIAVSAKDGAWKEALAAAEQELRRALQYGFTAAELKREAVEISGALHTAAQGEDTRSSAGLANGILATIGHHWFLSTPRTSSLQFDATAKTLTPTDINAAFHELWTGSAPLVHVSTKQDISSQELAAAFAASRTVAVAAPKDTAAQAFAYASFGPAGTVVEDKRIADLGVRTVRFANNVRLNIKKTDFETDRVRFEVRLGNGVLDLPQSEPGLAAMLSLTSAAAGLKKHSAEDLRQLLAGKAINFGASVQDDAFVAAGTTTPGSLAMQMKVSAAYLLDPGFRQEAADQWTNALPIIEKQLDAQPESVAGARLPILLANGDQRFGVPETAVLSKRTFAEGEAALAPVIASAPIEVTMVGDIDEESAIAAVASSFGALPRRKLTDPVPVAERSVEFRTVRSPIRLTHDGPQDKALVETVWPTTDDSNYRQVVGMELLKSVLELMLTDSVREKLRDSYDVSVASSQSNVFRGYGYLSVAAVVAPDKAAEVQQAIADAAASLRDKPVSADLLDRARNPVLDKADQAMRDNGFWLSVLSRAQSEPKRLDRIRQMKPFLQAVTPADLQKLAQQYLRPDRLQEVRVMSSKAATTASR